MPAEVESMFSAKETPWHRIGNVTEGALTSSEAIQKAELDFNRAVQSEPVDDLYELDVRKTHGDKRIENPKTGNKVKLRTALKAKKGSKVYQQARKIYNNLKDEE